MVKAFIDSSSLFKKYTTESGYEDFDEWMEKVSDVFIAPITILELHSIVYRRFSEKAINAKEAAYIKKEIYKDIPYFHFVRWNERFEVEGCLFIEKFGLKASDSIQLAAACMAEPDVFLTSDKRLFNAAQMELQNAVLISG